LEDSEKFNSNLMENSPKPILVINPDTSIKYVNEAMERIVGFKSDILLGIKPPFPWWPENSKEEISKYFRRGLKGDFTKGEFLFVLHQSGQDERYKYKERGDDLQVIWVQSPAKGNGY